MVGNQQALHAHTLGPFESRSPLRFARPVCTAQVAPVCKLRGLLPHCLTTEQRSNGHQRIKHLRFPANPPTW